MPEAGEGNAARVGVERLVAFSENDLDGGQAVVMIHGYPSRRVDDAGHCGRVGPPRNIFGRSGNRAWRTRYSVPETEVRSAGTRRSRSARRLPAAIQAHAIQQPYDRLPDG